MRAAITSTFRPFSAGFVGQLLLSKRCPALLKKNPSAVRQQPIISQFGGCGAYLGEESVLFGEWDPISLKERCNVSVKEALGDVGPKKDVFWIISVTLLRADFGRKVLNV